MTNTPKSSKRAVITFKKGKVFFQKEVPASRALIIAHEYKMKTGNSVKIKL